MIKKIISGGQDGADIAGLKAAKEMGIETGGTMPKGFITEDGNKPEYKELYNIEESFSPEYPPRTEQNVKDSDGTIRFAADFQSAGERCTLKFIKKHNKPYFDFDILNLTDDVIENAANWINDNLTDDVIENAANWMNDNNIEILNVAGNAEKKYPGIESFVRGCLIKIIVSYIIKDRVENV